MLVLNRLALLLLVIIKPFSAAAEDVEMKIGVLAFRGAQSARSMWAPTAEYLSNNIEGYRFDIVPLDLQGMRLAARDRSVDFVLTNPGNYVDLEAGYGASRLATLRNVRQGEPYTVFAAVILTRADHDSVRTLQDLKGRSFMAVSQQAFGGFQMAWRELEEKGIDPFSDFSRIEFADFPQDRIVYAVRDGKVDAGTVRSDTLARMALEGKINLSSFSILNEYKSNRYPFPHSTRIYPEWPFAKLKHTPEQLGQQVAISLLTLSPESAVAVSAKSAGWTIPLDYGPVHDLFRSLKIGPYEALGKVTLTNVLIQYWRWLLGGMTALLLMGVITAYVLRINRHLALSEQILQREISERKQVQAQLARHRDTLERTVKERTRELREDIRQREKAEEALRRSESTLRRLHEITTAAESVFEQKLHQLLELGCDHFELPTGVFSRIREEQYEVVEAVSTDDGVKKGGVVPLQDTFCQLALTSKDAVAIEHAGQSEFRDLLMVQHTGLEAYFGAAVQVTGKRFGTLCFFSTEPRNTPFSSVDRDILQLMAQWVGEEIARQNSQDEARQHQDALAHVSRLETMGQMASALAHELNQPLTAVVNYTRGCIRRLQSPSSDPGQLVGAMEQAVTEAGRAAEIIRGLREFVSKEKAQRGPVDLNTAIREAARIAEAEARQNQVGLHFNLAEPLPLVDADMIQLEQVILNLMRNGFEAMSSDDIVDRQLYIRSSLMDDGTVEVAVRDTGLGLPQVPVEDVFHPFFTTKHGGMGMGLSISRSIIDAHGGRLQADSAEGGGSVFRFTLPVIPEGSKHGA